MNEGRYCALLLLIPAIVPASALLLALFLAGEIYADRLTALDFSTIGNFSTLSIVFAHFEFPSRFTKPLSRSNLIDKFNWQRSMEPHTTIILNYSNNFSRGISLLRKLQDKRHTNLRHSAIN